MSDLTLNGARVMSADLILPHEGRWTADVHADLDAVPARGSSAVLHLLGRDYLGAVEDIGSIGGVTSVRVVGGTKGLDKTAKARGYLNGTTVGRLWQDLLSELGETPAGDAAALTTTLQRWERVTAVGTDLVGQIADLAGALWRTRADGVQWIGQDAWTATTADWTLIGGSLESGRLEISAEVMTLDPGQVLDGIRVRSLIHKVRPETSRTTLILDRDNAVDNPVLRMVDRWLRRRGWDYSRPQPGKAVSQNADGTLEVQLDDTTRPAERRCPIRWGLPGVTAKIQPGARVLVEWERGSPQNPVVTAWDQAAVQELVVSGGSKGAARVDDLVDAGYLLVTRAAVGLGGVPVVVSVEWLPPGTTPAPASVPPLITAYPLRGKIISGSSILKVGG